MKVILLKDVPRVGKKYEVVDVSNGYANNLLLPQKLAEPATAAKVAELDARREALKAEEDAKQQALIEKLETLGEETLTITVKADDQGHLYKKIQAPDIISALKDDLDIELPDTAVILESPISETGDHEVTAEAADKKVTFTVMVVKE